MEGAWVWIEGMDGQLGAAAIGERGRRGAETKAHFLFPPPAVATARHDEDGEVEWGGGAAAERMV